MDRLLRNSHKAYVLFVSILCCLPFFPVLYFLIKNPIKHYVHITRIRKWILSAVAFLSGIRFDVRYAQRIDWDNSNYIFCANHSSMFDVFAMERGLEKPFSFLGKDALLRNPFTAMFFRSVDIPVKRSSKISSYKAYKRCREVLEMGHSLAVFPEGGIDSGNYPPQLQGFKNGLFKLAIEKEVAIVPVVIHDLWKLCWDNAQLGTKPGVCHIEVLEPIATHDFTLQDEEALKALVRGRMEACINLFREHVTLA